MVCSSEMSLFSSSTLSRLVQIPTRFQSCYVDDATPSLLQLVTQHHQEARYKVNSLLCLGVLCSEMISVCRSSEQRKITRLFLLVVTQPPSQRKISLPLDTI